MQAFMQCCRTVLLALGLSVNAALAATTGLPAAVAQSLLQAGVPETHVSLWVQPVDSVSPTLTFHDQHPMNPASVMKLVTAFAALEALGPAHTWTTRIAAYGQVTDKVLHGDLYLVGGADPLLSYERLWKMLRKIREMGITVITGDIILDSSILQLPAHDPYAFDGKGLRPYNSGPYGLLLHFNTLHLMLTPPSSTNMTVSVIPHPPLDGLTVSSTITATKGGCGAWYRGLDATLEPSPTGAKLILSGTFPISCGTREWAASPFAAEHYAGALVVALWHELGGSLSGSVRSGTTPAQATTLLTESSPALAEALREMNKWSSNVIARQLLATLGTVGQAQVQQAPDDAITAGVTTALQHMDQAGIPIDKIVIENGSGLSRIARIPAASLGKLLLLAWRRPYMPEFISSLPIAGVDGTARRHLNTSSARGYAHIKTGTINEVRTMAGYVLDRNGRRHAVVMMVNHPNAGASKGAQDALLEWIWEAR